LGGGAAKGGKRGKSPSEKDERQPIKVRSKALERRKKKKNKGELQDKVNVW